MTNSIAGRSEYAVGLCGLLFSVALAPLLAAGCADDPAPKSLEVMDADAGTPVDPCTDGKKSSTESDVDCGGTCAKCADDRECRSDSDCVNNACILGYCRAPACDDERKNGDETDVDCGGSCGRACAVGMGCARPEDCSTGLCGPHGKCLPTTCGDHLKNDVESDVDCGGTCAPCSDSMACRTGYDCTSGVCVSGKCVPPACDDGVLNGEETDLDCGGSCSTKCGEGKKCNVDEHCATNICSAPSWGDTTRRCRAPGCYNYAKDSGETDIDCGGPCSSKCQDGQGCLVGDDCWSKVCDTTTGKCKSATCSDGVQNGSESDVDCGSSCPCADGKRCTWDGECASGVCDENVQKCLAPTCNDGVRNGDETDADCGGSCAAKCADGFHCADASDCSSGHCETGHCMP